MWWIEQAILLHPSSQKDTGMGAYVLYRQHSRTEVRLILRENTKTWWKYNILEKNLGYVFAH
jgi:hypothetical protein